MSNRFPLILDAASQQLVEIATGDNLDLTGNGIVGVESIEFADGSTAVKSTDVYTQAETDQRIQDVVGAAPAALDTLNELATALGNDANFAGTVTGQLTAVNAAVAQLGSTNAAEHAAFQNGLNAEIAARQAGDAALQSSLNVFAARKRDSRTLTSGDISVYADSSVPPQADPFGQSGWYFKNTAAAQKINWYTYINTRNPVDPTRPAGTDIVPRGAVNSIWAVVKIYTPTSRPFVTLYSAPTGTGDAASWYKSRWVYELSTTPVTPTAPGTYLMHFGTDPGVHQHLPRLVMPNVNTNGRGPMALTENILMYAWSTNSAAAVNSQDFTIEQTGHIFGDRETAFALVHTGASQADLAALGGSLSGMIGAEANERTAADAALQVNIDAATAAVATEADERIAGDSAVFDAAQQLVGGMRLPVVQRDGTVVLVVLAFS